MTDSPSDPIAAAVALLANVEKTQLLAAKAVVDAAIPGAQALLVAMPGNVGLPSPAAQFVKKVAETLTGFQNEATYILAAYPPA